jgi:hypothetical protein
MKSTDVKVGDKVIALGGINFGDYKEGDIGTVTDVTTQSYPKVRFPKWHGWPLPDNIAIYVEEAPVNKYGFKVGDKFKNVSSGMFPKGAIITLVLDDGSSCPLFKDERGSSHFADYKRLELIPSDPVEIAKANLAKAEAELKAAEEAVRKSKEFTEDDVKNFMVVKMSDDLRLVVISKERVDFFEINGNRSNWCVRDDLVKELNTLYTKTTLTAKDFFNA